MTSPVKVAELTTLDVDDDGLRVQVNMRDQVGGAIALELPTHCLTQLLMTLPTVIQKALRNRHGDDSLRLVHALENYRIELGGVDDAGQQQFIVTLSTHGGFMVSFSTDAANLSALSNSISDDVMPRTQTARAQKRLC